ncbi:Thioesterase superfamily [Anaerobranca californiensis DSM 14826]|jgi:predicted thioesterase|uniref:Thioesterase superfamily n=1 Tax=Anaerobranca californiensis DSM 14826 TaxID=1120989 RepID=A0A1M6NT16_9FIRM|nr:thioesterase family protein [Anaerobranca californiensis]SHJ98800.1 Thioesterase superfamily [Anaerobranca californiensis DSM 14826]
MEINLTVGMNAKVEKLVGEGDTAQAFGSGGVKVFATPLMIGLMENAALKAVDPHLPEGLATVGTHLDVKHLAATPVGMKVWAVAELLEIQGKRLLFKVEAFDQLEKIGEGTHERYIIKLDKFLEKAANKGK